MTPLIYWGSGAVALLCVLAMIGMACAAVGRLRELQRTGDIPSAGAERRSRRLARSVLAPHEFAQLRRQGYLDVPSPRAPAQRWYRLPQARGMIQVWEGDQIVERLCLMPEQVLPAYDEILALRLLILADEQDFLARANHFAELPLGQLVLQRRAGVGYAADYR